MSPKHYIMLPSLQNFAREFSAYQGEYVIIGGAACYLWFAEEQTHFRNTIDVDMVLLLQSQSIPFIKAFLDFAERVGYRADSRLQKNGDIKRRLYRFRLEGNDEYPEMIEVLGPDNGDIQHAFEQRCIPVKVADEYSGLSCMLLDDAYYGLLHASQTERLGIPVVSREALIALKIKAFLNILALHRNGTPPPHGSDTSMENARKHRKDVIALLYLPGLNITPVAPSIRRDIEAFATLLRRNQGERDSLIRSVTATQSLSHIPLDSAMLTEMTEELLELFPVASSSDR